MCYMVYALFGGLSLSLSHSLSVSSFLLLCCVGTHWINGLIESERERKKVATSTEYTLSHTHMSFRNRAQHIQLILFCVCVCPCLHPCVSEFCSFIPMVQFIFCVLYIFICSHTPLFGHVSHTRSTYLHITTTTTTHSNIHYIQLDNNIIREAFFALTLSPFLSVWGYGTNTSFDRLAYRIKNHWISIHPTPNATRLKIHSEYMRNTHSQSQKKEHRATMNNWHRGESERRDKEKAGGGEVEE